MICPLQTCMRDPIGDNTKAADKRNRISILAARMRNRIYPTVHEIARNRNRIQQPSRGARIRNCMPSRLILGLAPLHHLLPGIFSVHPIELLVVAGVLLVDDTPRLLVNRRVDCAVGIHPFSVTRISHTRILRPWAGP